MRATMMLADHAQVADGKLTPGSEISIPMSFNIVLQLGPSIRYSWLLDVDGQADDSWQLSFETRQAQAAPGMRR